MITQYLRAPPLKYITTIVSVQAGLVSALSLVTLALLLHRNWRRRRAQRQKIRITDKLISELLSLGDQTEGLRILRQPKWYQWGWRRSLRAVLLEQLKSMSGPEKTFLTNRYIELGFLHRDLEASRSIFWWRRLQALSHLAVLKHEWFPSFFHRLSKDPHELVAAFAYIPLSGLRHDLNPVQPLESLPAAVLKRQNVLHEILRNWCQVYGYQPLLAQIPRIGHPDLVTQVVRAIASEATPEIGEAFTQVLPRLNLPPGSVEQILILLRNVGDPASAPAIEPYLVHPSDVIRLRALEYFISTGNKGALQAANIYADPSVSIRRALQAYGFRRAA